MGALLSFSKTIYPHCCSRPRSINGYLVGCERLFVNEFAKCAMKGSRARNAPQGVEIVHTLCASLYMDPMTRDTYVNSPQFSIPTAMVNTVEYHVSLYTMQKKSIMYISTAIQSFQV